MNNRKLMRCACVIFGTANLAAIGIDLAAGALFLAIANAAAFVICAVIYLANREEGNK